MDGGNHHQRGEHEGMNRQPKKVLLRISGGILHGVLVVPRHVRDDLNFRCGDFWMEFKRKKELAEVTTQIEGQAFTERLPVYELKKVRECST